MNKATFVTDLKKSLVQHFAQIKEAEEVISFGIYTDGDASTIGIYYNTKEYLNRKLEATRKNEAEDSLTSLYLLFFMEEWKKDISEATREPLFDDLNQRIAEFGSSEYASGNENYKNEVFDLFAQSLREIKEESLLKPLASDFFLHLEVSDFWIDEQMLKRISTIHQASRFLEYREYARHNNDQ